MHKHYELFKLVVLISYFNCTIIFLRKAYDFTIETFYHIMLKYFLCSKLSHDLEIKTKCIVCTGKWLAHSRLRGQATICHGVSKTYVKG